MMLLTSIESIRNLRVSPLRNGIPRNAHSIVCVNGLTIVRLSHDRFWCDLPRFNRLLTHVGDSRTSLRLVDGLAKLGLIPRADADQYLAHHHRVAHQRELDSDRRELEKLAKRLGYKLIRRRKSKTTRGK